MCNQWKYIWQINITRLLVVTSQPCTFKEADLPSANTDSKVFISYQTHCSKNLRICKMFLEKIMGFECWLLWSHEPATVTSSSADIFRTHKFILFSCLWICLSVTLRSFSASSWINTKRSSPKTTSFSWDDNHLLYFKNCCFLIFFCSGPNKYLLSDKPLSVVKIIF